MTTTKTKRRQVSRAAEYRSEVVLRNVGRCPDCGGRVSLPCRECAVRAERRRAKLRADLRAGDLAAGART